MALIELDTCYFDADMKPTVVLDQNGDVDYIHYCPYIPKFLFAGAEIGSTGELGRMELPRSKLG